MSGSGLWRTAELPLISDYVAHHAVESPDAEALIFEAQRHTYADFERRVEACARALLASGVSPDDRVAMLSTPRPEFMIVFMAAARIGAIWLGLNPKARLAELTYIVSDAEPKVLFSISDFEGRDYSEDISALMQQPSLECLIALDGKGLAGAEPFDAFIEHDVDDRLFDDALHRVGPDHAALIVYTSGSTGRPKGALLSHRGIVRTCREQCAHWWAEPFRILGNLPINHVGMAVQSSCQALVAGGALVFMERFDPQRMGEVIARDRVTIIHQVATIYQILLDREDLDEADLASLQTIIWSGAPAPRELIARLRSITPHLFTSYGSTEVGGEVLYAAAGADDDTLATTVGTAPPGFALRLADEDGRAAGEGEEGEIQVKAETVMLGYFRRPDETGAAFTDDGWLHTGDVGLKLSNGDYRIVGRLKEMFKSGGYNIYPREIEAVIEAHDAVAMAAVIAVADPIYSEVGHAFVLLESGAGLAADEIEAHCREWLSNYKVPKAFEIRSDLPMLPIGKIDKKALKRLAGAGAA